MKVHLLQNGKNAAKKKTSNKREDRNPVYNEAMTFAVPAATLQVDTASSTYIYINIIHEQFTVKAHPALFEGEGEEPKIRDCYSSLQLTYTF